MICLEKSPNELIIILGEEKALLWKQLRQQIEERYDMDLLWGNGGKRWDSELKFRRGGKTLCGLYAKENCFGFMVIFGKAEQSRFEATRSEYSEEVCRVFDEATVYYDGKWMMFTPEDASEFDDYKRLLSIKRKPNRKAE